jgi:hypothetical protein
MKNIRIKVYKFNELSQDAQDKAIEKLNSINVDFDWWVYIYEDAKEIGLKITSFDLDRNRHAKGEFILSAAEVSQNIINNHGENCETYKTASNFLEYWQPIFNAYTDEENEKYESREAEEEMQEIEEEFLYSLLEDYSIMLQNGYEYLQSDEAIIETIEANDYHFLANGELFN